MVNICLAVAAILVCLGLRKSLRERNQPIKTWLSWSRYRLELLVIGSATLGALWGQEYPALLALAVLMPLFWSFAESRREALLITVVYYLGASRDLPQGAGIFFDVGAPLALGYGLWAFAGLVNASVWAVCWQRNPAHRAVAAQFALVLTAIPPVGVIGWANPVTAAGWLFPFCGVLGLCLTMLLVAILVSRSPRMFQHFGYLVCAGAVIANLYATYLTDKDSFPVAKQWAAFDSHFSKLQSGSAAGFFARVQAVLDLANQVQPNQIVLLPESILPEAALHTDFSALLLQNAGDVLRQKNSLILVGTEVTQAGGVDNVLMPLGLPAAAPKANLVQRVPVPVGMWRPWSKKTYTTNFLGSGVASVGGQRVAYLICYEQLLVYPIVLSSIRDPNLIVGASNDWWARNGSIPKIQQAALLTWGRLLGVPTFSATNY